MPGSAKPPRSAQAMALFILVGFWVLAPLLSWNQPANDFYPPLSAATLVPHDNKDVYIESAGEFYDPPKGYAAAYCDFTRPVYAGDQCNHAMFPFVISPPSLLLIMPLARLGPRGGVLVFRLLGGLCFAFGFAVLWARWGRLRAASPSAETSLLLTALVLTPLILFSESIGQSAPMLFAAGAMGISAVDRPRWRVLGGIVIVAAAAFKLLSVLALWVPVVHRRWRYLRTVVAVGVVTAVLTLVFVPVELIGRFLRATSSLDEAVHTYPGNIAVESLTYRWLPDLVASSAGRGGVLAVRVAFVVGLGWWSLRRVDADSQWAWSMLAALLIVPLVWNHYLVVAVPAVAYPLAVRTPVSGPWLWALPAVTLAVVVAAFVPPESAWLSPVCLAVVLGVLVLSSVLCRGVGRQVGTDAAAPPLTPAV